MDKNEIKHRIDLLKSNVIFTKTDEKVLEKLAELFKEVELDAGHNVMKKGDPSTAMYIILKGTVRIHDGGHVFGMLDEGDIFGEYSLLDTMPRSAYVTTITKAKLLKLDNNDLSNDKQTRNALVQGIMKVLTQRLREYNVLEEKLTRAYSKIKLQNRQLEEEKKRIEKQNAEILQMNEEIRAQKDEIEEQKKNLEIEKKLIEEQNAEISQMNEEIRAQRDEITKQRDQLEAEKEIIEEHNAEIIQLNEEIKTQRDELEKQKQELLKEKNK